MWKVLNTEVDLLEPTSFLGSCILWAALEDNAKEAKMLWTITEPCSNLQFPRVSREITIPSKSSFSSLSYDMAGHAKKCVQRYFELANKTTQQLYEVSTPCIDDHHFKKEEICWRIVKYLLSKCSEMFILGTNGTTRYSMVSK